MYLLAFRVSGLAGPEEMRRSEYATALIGFLEQFFRIESALTIEMRDAPLEKNMHNIGKGRRRRINVGKRMIGKVPLSKEPQSCPGQR